MSRNKASWSERLVGAKPQHFWWGLVIVICVCLAALSWTFVPHVFENPHKAKNYKILERIGRLPEIKSFSALNPPAGEIRTAKNLYSNFHDLSEVNLEKHNENLIKNYIGNFKYDYLNTYIKGDFRVIQCRALNENDVFTNGIAIQAVALNKPDKHSKEREYPVWIEIILPNAPESAAQHTKKGDLLEINKNPYFASILYVQRLQRDDDDPIMNFTVVPLVYESSWNPAHGSKFTISPAKRLNIDSTFPIFK